MNILMLTTIYPLDGTKLGFTPVVKYFCEEWVRQGHKIAVVNNSSRFPSLFYHLPKPIEKMVESLVGFTVPDKKTSKEQVVQMNGVTIYQLPWFKKYPGEVMKQSTVLRQYDKIVEFLSTIDFVPEVVMAHWVNPQAQLLELFKRSFGVKTSLVLHSTPRRKELMALRQALPSIDLGFRNEHIRALTLQNFEDDPSRINSFLCYSGVQDIFGLAKRNFYVKEMITSKIRILFVGQLVRRKYPKAILQAVDRIKTHCFEVVYVGEGHERGSLSHFQLSKHVSCELLGRRSREEVYRVMQESDIFIMISENEAFGLVYLEAMLNRCIVIAARNEGMHGIIKDGVNGFLCEAGNSVELQVIITKVLSLSAQKRAEIQEASYCTAVGLTEDKAASRYLESISVAGFK